MPAIAPQVYHSMGLTTSEFERIVALLGREPSMTELGMFAVMWSEHCAYKRSRPVLAYFRQYREAVEGGGLENAGVVPIGDGLGVVMKVESHNHPSAVEPYQGAATGVGGIIRDIFTMGARPIAALNSLRFGPIVDGQAPEEVVRRNRYLFEHVVAGIAGYGNCVGVPTVGGEVYFHERYSGNPLVNAMCVGLVPLGEVATAGATGVGNPVLYLGSATGRDGIHGATFASDVLGEDSGSNRPNVQIGDPFAEKLLIEATLEALRTGAVAAIQDMGAAGLTCSTTEMSAKGGVGMAIDLDLVPLRERDMSAYEIMLSESQERMLCVAHAGRESEVIAVFQKWGVHAVAIGHVTDDGLVTARRHGDVEVNAPARLFTDECPVYQMPSSEPDYFRSAGMFSLVGVTDEDPRHALLQLLWSPSLASKRWVFQQYDTQVQTQTTLLPGDGDGAVLAPRGTQRGLSLSIDGNGRWVYLDPYVGGQLAVCEAARNVACTGAMPIAATDGLNYGNPELPHVFWQFERSVRGIADACEALGTPVVSGNVSFYNDSDLGEVLPTPMIGMLGVMTEARNRVGSGFPFRQGAVGLLWVETSIGTTQGLGASAYLAEVHQVEDGRPVAPNLAGERDLYAVLVELARQGHLLCAHDVSDGGTAFALAEMTAVYGVGAAVTLDDGPFAGLSRRDARLFGEFPGWVLIGFDDASTGAVKAALTDHVRFTPLGHFDPDLDGLSVAVHGKGVLSVATADVRTALESAIPRLMSRRSGI